MNDKVNEKLKSLDSSQLDIILRFKKEMVEETIPDIDSMINKRRLLAVQNRKKHLKL